MWTEKSSNASVAENMTTLISVRNVALCYRYQKSIFARHKTKIWALHDVTFDLIEGEKLGIIGRNGSGKSTLMKILAKIFEPDQGSVTYSRPLHVQLLSLGVGFEGSLSGRENALLNGLLLGKSRRHMLGRLEKIKDFSELGEFFEMPVSTYSSGMGARLGFSVAMETEPEVLLIDEILGVGDARFATKSENALRDKFFGKRTVVLISHAADTIRKMCTRAVWIEKGRTIMEGDVKAVADAYEAEVKAEDPNIVRELRPD
jgi:lipopolysaccharide transport system ATP-binding protein